MIFFPRIFQTNYGRTSKYFRPKKKNGISINGHRFGKCLTHKRPQAILHFQFVVVVVVAVVVVNIENCNHLTNGEEEKKTFLITSTMVCLTEPLKKVINFSNHKSLFSGNLLWQKNKNQKKELPCCIARASRKLINFSTSFTREKKGQNLCVDQNKQKGRSNEMRWTFGKRCCNWL